MKSEQVLATLRAYIQSDPKDVQAFFENDALIWVNWRDFDDSIVDYFNAYLPEPNQIAWELRPTDKDRGEDLVLKNKDREYIIPYQDDKMDRDTTLKSVNEFLGGHYQIRWVMQSLGNDTLAFVLLPTADWNALEEEFTEHKVRYYFSEIQQDTVIFDWVFDEVKAFFDIYENTEDIDASILQKIAKLQGQLKRLDLKKEANELSLDDYNAQKQEIDHKIADISLYLFK